jgi:LuxR family transcriptional regulator, maltose regulon positive regulatory protein
VAGPAAQTADQSVSLAKLTIPRLTAPLPRAALFKQLDKARLRALTVWVAAPAGSGKTMLAASYVKSCRANW